MRKKHPVLVKLGKRIRELRKQKGFTQEEFSFEVGLDRGYMGRVERGESNITILVVWKIANALKIKLSELF